MAENVDRESEAQTARMKEREKQNKSVETSLELLKTQRDELMSGANEVYCNLHNFDEEFDATNAVDFFMSPEAMDRMIEEFQVNTKQSTLTLAEIESNLEALTRAEIDPRDSKAAREADLAAEAAGLAEAEKLTEEHKKKIAATTERISTIFAKSKKNYNDLVASISHDFDGDLNATNGEDLEAAMIPILQQKLKALQKDLELSRMKSRSLSVQM